MRLKVYELVIANCAKCPNVEWEMEGFNKKYRCGMNGRDINAVKIREKLGEIPEWCPLEDVDIENIK